MDIHSGVFTAPLAGVYLFLLHIATHDNKKALLSIRRNGEEIASVFDQNHKDNHKNSMAGQNLLLDCQRGDEVREVSFDILLQVPVYVYNCTITRRKNFVLLFCFFDSPPGGRLRVHRHLVSGLPYEPLHALGGHPDQAQSTRGGIHLKICASC